MMKAFAFVIFATVALGYSIVQAEKASEWDKKHSDCTSKCEKDMGAVNTKIVNEEDKADIIRYIEVR